MLKVLDGRFATPGGPGNGHYIKAGRIIQQAMPTQIADGQSRHPPLLVVVDRVGRMTGILRTARFDFDENHRSPVDHHQIQLAQRPATSAGHDLVTTSPQVPGRGGLAALPQSLWREEPLPRCSRKVNSS